MITGETRSELLVRLLRSEISDNNPNNVIDTKPDDMITELLSRVERLEQLIDNKLDNIIDIKPDSVEIAAISEVKPEVANLNMVSLAKRLNITEKTLRKKAASDESWHELMESNPDPESLQWSLPVKVGKVWRIDCLA